MVVHFTKHFIFYIFYFIFYFSEILLVTFLRNLNWRKGEGRG